MKVVVYPADLHGCGYYRLTWPAKILQSMGHDVHIVHPDTINKVSAHTDGEGRIIGMVLPKISQDADVLVFQRVTSARLIDAFHVLKEMGKAVVVDVDDDMGAVDQRNPAWLQLNPGRMKSSEYNWLNGKKACEAASLVTVSSDALLRRYGQPRKAGDPVHGVILRNYVPAAMTAIARNGESGVIGWGGSLATHPEDPDVVGNSMQRIAREGFRFKIVGPPQWTREAFRLNSEPMSTGPVRIQDWPHRIAEMSVGVCPLKDTRFNASKSWLKPLEYSAVGVPPIMSPRAEYSRLHKLGVGLLADTPREWYRHAKRLLSDDVYREEMSERGREIVREHLTLETNAYQWWDAWTMAYERLHSA